MHNNLNMIEIVDGLRLVEFTKPDFHIFFFYESRNVTEHILEWFDEHNIDFRQAMTDEDKLALSFYITVIGKNNE